MSTALRPRYTLDEYVEMEDGSTGVKHEYVSGEIFAMSGGSPEHAALTNALVLLTRLRGCLSAASAPVSTTEFNREKKIHRE